MHLKILLVEGEVIEHVGEGVDDGDEFVAPDVGLGLEHEGNVQRVLLPHEGVQQLDERRRQVPDQLHPLQDADADFGGEGPDLENSNIKWPPSPSTPISDKTRSPLEGTGR